MNLRQTAIAAFSAACLLVSGAALAADQDHRGHDRGRAQGHPAQAQAQARPAQAQARRDYDRRGSYVGTRGGSYVGTRDSVRVDVAARGRNWGGRGRVAYVRPRFGPVYRFEWNSWRGGRWYHSWHNGIYGWWWVIGDDWFDYPAPVYPYPYPVYYYDDPVYDEGPAPYDYNAGPPPESAPPVEQSWYYCDNPRGYYPYVRSCPGGWRAVPATPPGDIRGQ